MPVPEYPGWFIPKLVSQSGAISFSGRPYFVTTALNGEHVGLLEIEEGCYEVYFCKYLLGRIHHAHPELGMVIV